MPRQRRHLRARLDLKHADGVGLLQHPVDGGIVGRQMREIDRRSRRQSGSSAAAIGRHWLTIAIASSSTAIMPRPSRSTLTMPRSAQSSLSHCTTTRPGHRRGLERHDLVEPALADDHAARVLAEMPRQILHLAPQRRELLVPRIVGIEAGFARDCAAIVSSGSTNSNWLISLRQPIDLVSAKPSTLPTSRAALGRDT